MKTVFPLSLLPLLAFTGAQDCSNFQALHSFQPGVELEWVVTVDDESPTGGLFRAQVTYEGLGWVGLGFSPTGGMVGSLAVIGLPDAPDGDSNPGKYDLLSYSPTTADLSSQQTLMDHSVTQNETHTVLTFSKYLKEDGEIEINPQGDNFILVATGSSNTFGYHAFRASESLTFEPCEEPPAVDADAAAMDTDAAAVDTSAAPTGSPTISMAPTTSPTNGPTEAPTEMIIPDTSPPGEIVNCSEFQSTHAFDDIPMTIEYVVVEDDSPNLGILSARVTYEGVGYVGMGFSSDGRMVGPQHLAVIGEPDEPEGPSNPGKRNLAGFDTTANALTDQQTLMNHSIFQNDTHTVLEFSKYLKEDGEIEINPSGTNFILVAAGISNAFGSHRYRASVGLVFQPCVEGQLASNVTAAGAVSIEFDDKKRFFKVHGIMAAIAWGLLAPLAIANSMCRHLIPKQGLWFEAHRGFNIMVFVLTVIAFAVVVKALEDTSGGNADHFKPREGALGKHHTIGLVVFILVIVQCIGGMMRPHLPSPGEKPSAIRVMWEFGHKGCGISLLAMGWYQCHSGLVLYARRFTNEEDYVGVFWGITATIAAIGFAGKIHGLLTRMPELPAQKANGSTANEEHETMDA
ncbi:Eukaryotic cytochrome b561 [Seminavis robusta]|uniref:Eukaryotic cytochrome b561 n=1 Tax=Seminavis robusta TaxID=568900 RepID=A0A9N8DM07_9STRA|nr:Eukaryotic cytochrome b561 [Seminavis robusta]|eukprot:Sro216_g089400.1 Eukaryotic cytochrome b561 (629) ;mRNA; f:49936-51822